MAKKKHHHEEHVDETWLIPYADLLTLLLALFIVLFASSSVDAKKFEALAYSLNTAFKSGSGVLDYPSPVQSLDPTQTSLPPVGDKSVDPAEGENDVDSKEKEKENEFDETMMLKELNDLQELKQKIDHYISDKNLALSLKTELTERGLLITILDNALFDSGSAVIKSEARQLAHEISQLLYTDPPRHVEIGGHTDNRPISTSQFRDNWDLSSVRSLNFMKILLQNSKLEPHRFSATGYGEYRPVATNQSAEGRAKNRRVEVLIKPNYAIRLEQ
ncbi:flagellar motor protein MotB [Caldalkalibacillus mannanilyticus]|uniref:flagellar motor protein MotB n=1 Tax=Caldalkalibacillus mannanilyticus TaxID=1418 RepID=UPI00046879BF|nr:flagellar motor protein MotB [Caldalkalibacillus mannanilyticus]